MVVWCETARQEAKGGQVSDVETWAVRAAVMGVIAALGGLFLRVRTNESRLAVAEKSLERYEGTEKTVHTIDVTLARIDTTLQHLPKHDDLQRIHDRISSNGSKTGAAASAIAGLTSEVEGLRTAVDRLHTIELNRENKA